MGANADLLTYFEKIATNHLSIAHSTSNHRFFRTELDEFLESMNLTGLGNCLILESTDYSTPNPSADNMLKYRSIAFMVVKHCDTPDDYSNIATIYDDTEEIADEIIRKIFYDTYGRAETAFCDVKLDSVSVNPVANFADYNYGQRVVISMQQYFDTTPDPAKWKAGFLTLDERYVGDD